MRLFFAGILFLSFYLLHGQQEMQYSQYMLDKYHYNPAYGGLELSLHVNTAIRSQWNGLEGNPKSQYINAHMPFYIWNGSIGMSLLHESAGALDNIHLAGSYNYVIKNEYGLFSFGLALGVLQKSVNGSDIITPDGDYVDNTFNHNDPVLAIDNFSGFSPTWNAGFYYIADRFDIGFSVANIPTPKLSANNSSFSLGRVANLYGEYRYDYNSSIVFVPNFLIKTNFDQYQTDFSVMGKYNGNIFGSIGVRGYSSASIDAIILMVGTKINPRYSISYSYDAGLSAIKRVNEGSHELRLSYNLNKVISTGMPPKIIYNPRNL